MADSAEEAKRLSQMHQKTMIEYLKSKGNSCSYGDLVDEMEKHHCDTVGAQLKILKGKGVIGYEPMFLMYPGHKDEMLTLKDPNFDPTK